jgi:hypothetical protein
MLLRVLLVQSLHLRFSLIQFCGLVCQTRNCCLLVITEAYIFISAANNMADIRGTCATMLAFVIVLFSYVHLCIVVEVKRT